MSEKALLASFKKWEILCGKDLLEDNIDISSGSCPLCAEHRFSFITSCDGCEIATYTGVIYCRETPYLRVEEALEDDYKEGFEIAAKEEVEFLKKVYEKYYGDEPF